MKALISLNVTLFLIFFISKSNIKAQSFQELIYPFQGEVTNKSLITFRWNHNPVENELFQFQLATDSTFINPIQDIQGQNHYFSYNGLGPSNITYYWRVRKLNPNSTWSEIRRLDYFNPQNISGLTLWLNPTTGVVLNGGTVQQINDQSLFGNNAVQTNSTQRPIYVSSDTLINNQPSIKYDGSNDFLDIADNTSLDYTSEFTAFALVKPRVVATNKTILAKWDYQTQGAWVLQTDFSLSDELMFTPCFTITDPGNQKYYTDNADLLAQKPTIISLKYDGNAFVKAKFYKNSNLLSTTLVGTIPQTLPNCAASLKVGKYGGVATRYYDGDITEVLIYNNALIDFSRNQVEKYYRFKYCPPVTLGSDTVISINSNCGNLQLKAPFKYQSYLWSNGSTSSRIYVNQPGTYWVTVTDFMGNISSDTIKVYPPYSFNYPQNNFICAEQSATWTTNFPSSGFTFLWQNGSTASTMPLQTSGAYFVKITDGSGCFVKSDTILVTIDNYSNTATLGSDTSLCIGNSVGLLIGGTETSSYVWNDGSNQPFFLINNIGSYNISLTSTNINNCIAHDTIQVNVFGIAPNPIFNINTPTCSNSAISFSESSTIISPYIIQSVNWAFSNGYSSSSSSIQVLFSSPGWITGELLVNSSNGCIAKDTFSFFVFDPPNLIFNTSNFCSNENILFVANNLNGDTLVSHQWNFGDNTTSNLSTPTHLYNASNNYNITLNATDINNCSNSIIQPMNIQPSPVAIFSYTSTCEKNAVDFTNNSSISDTFSIITNQWFYGDNTQSVNPSNDKIYENYGDYIVQLIVTANNGCKDSTQQSITINPNPILAWQIGPSCKNTWTTFENQSIVPNGNINETYWMVNLQYPLQGSSTAYQFVTTGIQYLNLTSVTDHGCSLDTLIIIDVQPEINASYTINPTISILGIPLTFSSTSTGASQYNWNFGLGDTLSTTDNNPIEIPSYSSAVIGDSILTYLAIENTIGCKDTAFKYVRINEPRIDLAISQLFIQEINGFYKVGVELKNLGFIKITKTDLFLKMYNSTEILETDIDTLLPGESSIFLFNSSPTAFISNQDDEKSYLCVEANSFNEFQFIETILSNNIYCLNTENSNLILLPIFPNPTDENIIYSFNLSEESEVKTILMDETGRKIDEQKLKFTSGMHTESISIINLRAGIYYFYITDGVSSKTVKILKN